jgi:peptide/nickel transport system ATP-binding protein
VHDVAFQIGRGETLALVGESGSGKTTIARAIVGLAPARGSIVFDGRDANRPIGRRERELRRRIQYVFQNPDASLNPQRRVAYLIGRPIEFFFGLPPREVRRRVAGLLEAVHLDPRYIDRFPGELSGGERQRVAIAQALAAEPDLVLCDEVVSALDVSVQASILDLLREIQAARRVSYLFIAHDLAVVRWLADRVVVLYGGWVMETGSPDQVFSRPSHPYTEALLACIPELRPVRRLPVVDVPAAPLGDSGVGCPFVPRCRHRIEGWCEAVRPPWRVDESGHGIRCQHDLAELARRQASGTLGDAELAPTGTADR